MAKHKVRCNYEEFFIVEVEADSEEEAISSVYKELEDGGIEAFQERDVTHREYGTS